MAEMLDVIVIGLGGVGSAAASHLAARRKRVLGIEQFEPAHDRGSSHGGSRIIRQAYHEHPDYVPLVLRAYELWRDLERSTGTELLTITGGLLIGPEDGDVVQGSLRSARMHSLPHELLTAADIRRRFPLFHAGGDETAVFELQAGFLRPERAVRAHLKRAEQGGTSLHFSERVLSWTSTAGGAVRVRTDRGTYEAASLILAPGAWAPQWLQSLDLPLAVRRHLMCWFDPVADLSQFLPDRFPIYLWQTSRGPVFYGFPAIDGPQGGAKAAMHSGGTICTPETLERSSFASDEEELRQELSRSLPALNGPLLHTSACMYTLTPDEHFLLGSLTDAPQILLAAGFSGHGFKFCSVLGEILAELATQGRTRHSIQFLSPSRFSGETTFSNNGQA